jgi:ribosome-binding protein aMBF1 (putative translation factor)
MPEKPRRVLRQMQRPKTRDDASNMEKTMPLVKELLAELEKAMKDQGWSLAEIARRAEIHPVALSRFRTQTKGLSIDSAEKLAFTLGFRVGLIREKSR